jgi:hypothetical protein
MHIYFNLLDILLTQTQIRVFVNKVVRKISGPERKQYGDWEYYIMNIWDVKFSQW